MIFSHFQTETSNSGKIQYHKTFVCLVLDMKTTNNSGDNCLTKSWEISSNIMDNCIQTPKPSQTPSQMVLKIRNGDRIISVVANTVLAFHINQCWANTNWTLTNKIQWNFNQNTERFIHENASENTSVKWRSCCPGGRWVKRTTSPGWHHTGFTAHHVTGSSIVCPKPCPG